MKRWGFFVTAIFVGMTGLALAHHGPENVSLDNKMGTVTFPHFAHQDMEIDCETCHHVGIETPNCHECHGVKSEAPQPKDAFHDLCKGCHQEQGGPTGCMDCHKK